MKTKCLIVDDEPLAMEVLQSHIEKLDHFEVSGTCKNAFEAINFLQRHKVDLLFLDINMPEMKGTDLIKNMHHLPRVIFTTAYREYALEGYDLNVLDYLLKPISFERFMQAISKYQDTVTDSSDITLHYSSEPAETFVYVREKHQVHKILTDNITMIESVGDYIKIHTCGQHIVVRNTIAAMNEMLNEQHFLRIHRSFIVSLRSITSFTANSVFIGKKELPIGPSYKKEIFKRLNYTKFHE